MRHPILVSSRGKTSTPRDRIKYDVIIGITGSLQACNCIAISGCINSNANGIYYVDGLIGDAMIVSK